MMAALTWLTAINEFLAFLPPTGEAGFEGLTTTLLDAFTGQRFRLSASGQQHGQDASSEPTWGNCIKVECKRYTDSTLDPSDLKGKLADAISSGPDLDLWVLAASCRVPAQLAADLRRNAGEHQVEVLFLDLDNHALPQFGVLMAACPEPMAAWVESRRVRFDIDRLRGALSELAAESQFEAAKTQLKQILSGKLLGYEDARQRTSRRFLSVIDDCGNAKATFNQPIAVRAPGVLTIPRVRIEDDLALWWTAFPSERRYGLVLGEEGMGKTWSVMDWLAGRVGTSAMPIVLPFSVAADSPSSGETIEDFLPRLLRKWTEVQTPQFWEKRVQRWLANAAPSLPIILIVADGLNERPAVDWPSFFRTLEDERWRDHMVLLVIDRPGHWTPNCARRGLVGFRQIQVGGYTDWELDRALQGKGISIGSIPHDLHPLIRTPLYCSLVCEHFDDMKANADFTQERLILLHAKHSAEVKRGPMTEDVFLDVIRNVASKFRTSPTLRLSEIPSLLPIRDPEDRIRGEIIDGGILVEKPDQPGRFTPSRVHLVVGLGMLLADDVREAAGHNKDRAETEALLARWLEPHPEIDLKVEICSSALFHALQDEHYPATGRRGILRYWLGLRNWGDMVQEAFVDHVVRCPEDFIQMAEEFWSVHRDVGAAQDFLGEAFAKHRDNPKVQPLLAAAIARWMGFIHPGGHPITRHNAEHEARRRREIERRVGRALNPGPIEVFGAKLTVVEDDGLLRLSRLGFRIISAGTRLPFIDAIVPWAISSAVMGGRMETEVANWVIRLADEDLEQSVFPHALRLLKLEDATAAEAAHVLLELIGTATGTKVRLENPIEQDPHRRLLRGGYEQDPCTSFFPWTDEDCGRCMSREDVPILTILGRLGHRAFAPQFPVPERLLQRAVDLLQHIKPTTFRTALSATVEHHAVEQVLPLLSAHAPHTLADFIRSVVRTMPERETKHLYPLALSLCNISPLFGDAELNVTVLSLERLRSLIPPVEEAAQDSASSTWLTAEAYAFLAAAPHMQAATYLEALLNRPPGARDLSKFEVWFDRSSIDAVASALQRIHSAHDDTTLTRALWFLSSHKPSLSDADRIRIVSLAQAENRALRGTAMRFAYQVEDEELGRRIVDLGYSCEDASTTFDGAQAARVLIRFSTHLPFDVVARRLHPADAGYALQYRGNDLNDVRFYAACLDGVWHRIVSAVDPEVPALPRVSAETHEGEVGTRVPSFANDSGGDTVVLKNWSITWSAGRPTRHLWERLFHPEQIADDLNRVSRERIEAVASAWKTEALQWYGRSFSSSALRQIGLHFPDLVACWTDPALKEGLVGQAVRERTGTFLATLCSVLFEQNPMLGFRLWKSMREDLTNPVRLNSVSIAFEAPDGTEAGQARNLVLDDCHDDAAISRIAHVAEMAGRRAWLRNAVEQMIVQPQTWRRLKGLTLASFSDVTPEEFESYVARSAVIGTWAEAQLPWLRQNVGKNHIAQHWFHIFLNCPDADVSWGALQLVLASADQRLFLWHERHRGPDTELVQRRLRFLRARMEDLEKSLDRDRERNDKLFGIKIERGEVFPFVGP